MLADPVVRWLSIGAFSVLLLILTLVLYIVAAGVINRPAPRTYSEKQIDLLSTVVAQKPDVPEAWRDYALALIAAKQYGQANRVIEVGLRKAGKDSPEILATRVTLLIVQDKPDEALKLADKVLGSISDKRAALVEEMAAKGVTLDATSYPNRQTAEDLNLMRGDIFASKKQWESAVKAYSGAIAENPTNADTLVKRGNAYLKLSETAKAKKDFQRALEFIPGFEPAAQGLEDAKKAGDK